MTHKAKDTNLKACIHALVAAKIIGAKRSDYGLFDMALNRCSHEYNIGDTYGWIVNFPVTGWSDTPKDWKDLVCSVTPDTANAVAHILDDSKTPLVAAVNKVLNPLGFEACQPHVKDTIMAKERIRFWFTVGKVGTELAHAERLEVAQMNKASSVF